MWGQFFKFLFFLLGAMSSNLDFGLRFNFCCFSVVLWGIKLQLSDPTTVSFATMGESFISATAPNQYSHVRAPVHCTPPLSAEWIAPLVPHCSPTIWSCHAWSNNCMTSSNKEKPPLPLSLAELPFDLPYKVPLNKFKGLTFSYCNISVFRKTEISCKYQGSTDCIGEHLTDD